MKDFDTFTKIAQNVLSAKYLIVARALKSCPTYNKSPNLVTLVILTIWRGYDADIYRDRWNHLAAPSLWDILWERIWFRETKKRTTI